MQMGEEIINLTGQPVIVDGKLLRSDDIEKYKFLKNLNKKETLDQQISVFWEMFETGDPNRFWIATNRDCYKATKKLEEFIMVNNSPVRASNITYLVNINFGR